ncbi:uncharacterized protein MONBRDRAFT_37388 [Monosiga brevicollis MX1]|uniref:EF-hand domain-containing protein n=1 Tax=Monosiga brevicollis TaxID=81824 RepID=A9V1E6_MONBE|nr:uncharacterized protein MONBRDRAFT_37388 [Monosiga brevicollis MX1]EDQ88426.1 predicted protein [Monosiga brevicollis MX1]|eukprot:XP_001746530.1 hypothetical protein [Monosiga brevicollis MX1]
MPDCLIKIFAIRNRCFFTSWLGTVQKLTSRLIQSIDQNEDRRIDRTETRADGMGNWQFLMAVLVTNKIVDQLMVDMIMKRYEELDVDKDGFLTNDDVRAVTRAAVAGKAEEASRGSREAFIEVRENSSL